MPYVNNDMDDLLKRAAKDYPLDTSTADWEKISRVLHGHSNHSNRKGDRRHYLWLLLLLPFTWLCNKYMVDEKTQIVNETNRVETQNLGNDIRGLSDHNNDLTQKQSTSEITELYRVKNTVPSSNNTNRNLLLQSSHQSSSIDKNLQKEIKRRQSVFEISANDETVYFNKNDFRNERIISNYPQLFAFEPLLLNTDRKRVPSLKAKNENTGQKKFYIGAALGKGISTVKFQKIRSNPFDVGLFAGYDVSKHWSIEAGVFSTQKKYYTKGSEFNTSKIYIPANTKLTSVDGNCRMLELPIAVRYNFSEKENGWFVSAGVSSYIMKEESYDYLYYYNNSGNSAKYSKTYKNATKNWASTLQLSGGYNFNLKRNLGIRAEPYLQVPLKGAGFGDLPLTNIGLRIGITSKLF